MCRMLMYMHFYMFRCIEIYVPIHKKHFFLEDKQISPM